MDCHTLPRDNREAYRSNLASQRARAPCSPASIATTSLASSTRPGGLVYPVSQFAVAAYPTLVGGPSLPPSQACLAGLSADLLKWRCSRARESKPIWEGLYPRRFALHSLRPSPSTTASTYPRNLALPIGPPTLSCPNSLNTRPWMPCCVASSVIRSRMSYSTTSISSARKWPMRSSQRSHARSSTACRSISLHTERSPNLPT
jgi:hypothetical protein